jgi:hypothetical protein
VKSKAVIAFEQRHVIIISVATHVKITFTMMRRCKSNIRAEFKGSDVEEVLLGLSSDSEHRQGKRKRMRESRIKVRVYVSLNSSVPRKIA